jgi:hypothetical protein
VGINGLYGFTLLQFVNCAVHIFYLTKLDNKLMYAHIYTHCLQSRLLNVYQCSNGWMRSDETLQDSKPSNDIPLSYSTYTFAPPE